MSGARGAVAKALDILRRLGENPDGLALSEVAEQVGLHGSTAYRTLAELVAGGFVTRGQTDRYYLGGAFLRLAGGGSMYAGVRAQLHVVLAEISEATGLMANAQVPEPTGSRVIDAIKPPRYRGLHDFRDEVVPYWAAAGGHVLLAHAAPALRAATLKRLGVMEGLATRAAFEARLDQSQEYARVIGGLDAVIGAVAIPVIDPDLGCWLALATVGVVDDVPENRVQELVAQIHRSSKQLHGVVRYWTDRRRAQ